MPNPAKLSSVDQDHKKILALTSSLPQQVNPETKRELISQLIDYLTLHEMKEEELMRECEYPLIYDHVQEHIKLQNYVVGNFSAAVNNLSALRLICTRVVQHIALHDERFHTFIKTRQPSAA